MYNVCFDLVNSLGPSCLVLAQYVYWFLVLAKFVLAKYV